MEEATPQDRDWPDWPDWQLDVLRNQGVSPRRIAWVKTEEALPEDRSNTWRIMQRFAVGLASEIPSTTKVLLHAILLRQSAHGAPCIAGVDTLGRDTGLGRSTIYRHIRTAREQEWLAKVGLPPPLPAGLTTDLSLDRETELEIRRMWADGAAPEPTPQKNYREDLPSLSSRRGPRFWWERSVRDAPFWAPEDWKDWRVGKLTRTSLLGVAWALTLRWNSRGQPFASAGPTTLETLGELSGYGRETARTALDYLVQRWWLYRETIPGEGWRPWLRLPIPVVNAILERRDR